MIYFMKRISLLLALTMLCAGCAVSRAETPTIQKPRVVKKLQPLITMPAATAPALSAAEGSPLRQAQVSSVSLLRPPVVRLDVPFTSQAPFKNWDEPYQNACEEASLLTVLHYLQNRPFTQELADQEIVALTDRTARMGYGPSITLQQLADITNALFPDYEPVLSTDVSIDSIKQLITEGKPIIVPTAGRMLHNPYYSGEGPAYHMLVITGYDETYFYTNDVGTGHGEHYPFPHQVLLDAIHDWTGNDDTIADGQKIMMTLRRGR